MSAKEKNIKIEGYVFTAALFDIVEIYNKLGSELFNFNVRCSIKDELEVDKKLQELVQDKSSEELYEILKSMDEKAASNIQCGNDKRIIRAIWLILECS